MSNNINKRNKINMIRHIVMFKLKEFNNNSEKTKIMQEIKQRLEALSDIIDCLHSIQVDFNVNPHETWDLILTTELPTMKDLDIYANHPAHIAVSKDVIAPYKADRACVDYEY